MAETLPHSLCEFAGFGLLTGRVIAATDEPVLNAGAFILYRSLLEKPYVHSSNQSIHPDCPH